MSLRRLLPAALAMLLALGLLTSCGGSSGTNVTAQFDDAAGLFEGNDVGVLGVRVGEVTKITPRGDHVDVSLHIDDGVKIPADAGAVVVSRSVATDRYVELTPVYDAGPVLASGTVLSRQRTRSPVEFDDLLASLRRISSDLSGSDKKAQPVNDLLEIAARTLDGKGATIGKGLGDLADALDDVNEGSGDTAITIKNLDTLTAALADNDRLVREFSSEVSKATGMLDDEHESLEATFEALAAMVRRVTEFSGEHRAAVVDQVDDMQAVVHRMVERRKGLERLVANLPLMMQNVAQAIDKNDRLNFMTRPVDLIPTEAALDVICSNAPDPSVCDPLKAGLATIFDLIHALAGVQTP